MNCPTCAALYGTRANECDTCLDYVNWCRLLLTPVSTGKDSEKLHALENTAKFCAKFLHTATLEDIHLYLQRVQGVAAGVSFCYSQRKVVERIPDPAELEKNQEVWKESIKRQKDAQRPKKERILLSDRDKAIQSLVTKTKLSLEMATQIVDEQMSKVGRKITDLPPTMTTPPKKDWECEECRIIVAGDRQICINCGGMRKE